MQDFFLFTFNKLASELGSLRGKSVVFVFINIIESCQHQQQQYHVDVIKLKFSKNLQLHEYSTLSTRLYLYVSCSFACKESCSNYYKNGFPIILLIANYYLCNRNLFTCQGCAI